MKNFIVENNGRCDYPHGMPDHVLEVRSGSKTYYECDNELLNRDAKGKVIESITDESEHRNLLTFNFTDGTSLRINYDWIYSIEMSIKNGGGANGGIFNSKG